MIEPSPRSSSKNWQGTSTLVVVGAYQSASLSSAGGEFVFSSPGVVPEHHVDFFTTGSDQARGQAPSGKLHGESESAMKSCNGCVINTGFKGH